VQNIVGKSGELAENRSEGRTAAVTAKRLVEYPAGARPEELEQQRRQGQD
jgi:hypothetical protein